MPINSFSRRSVDPSVGLQCFGTISKGLPRTAQQLEKRQPGTDVDYFVFRYNERYEWLKSHVERLYGTEPKELSPILILGATPEDSFTQWREQRGMNGKRVVLKCDEENIVEWMDEQTGRTIRAGTGGVEPRPCPGGRAEGGCEKCAFSGTIRLALPRLLETAKVYGYWYLNTHSLNDIAMINGVLNYWYEQRIGNVWEMPFVLGRAEDHAGWGAYSKDGKQIPVERRKNLLYLDAHEATAARLLGKLASETGALPPPADLDELTGEELPALEAPKGSEEQKPAASNPPASAPKNNPPKNAGAPAKAYDAEKVYAEVTRYFEHKGAFNTWFGKSVHDKKIVNETTDTAIVEMIRAEIHVLSLDKNKNELLKLIGSLGIKSSDVLQKFYPDRAIERLSQLPNDWNNVTERIKQVAAGTPPFQPDKPADDVVDGEFTESDDETPAAPDLDSYEIEDDENWKWTEELMQGFDMEIMTLFPRFKTAKELRDAFQVDQWTRSPKVERHTIFARAQKECWDVACTTVGYAQNDNPGKAYIVFFTVVGELRFYSRTEFAKFLPESWVRANGVMSWETLTDPRDIDPIILSWEMKQRNEKSGGGEYRVVTGARPADSLDAILNGTDEPKKRSGADKNPLLDD